MTTESVTFKQGGTGISLQHELNPTDVDLTGATVEFRMLNKSGKEVVAWSACNIDSIPNRLVSYDWGANDLDVPGEYTGEYRVTYVGGKFEFFPVADEIPITIRPV